MLAEATMRRSTPATRAAMLRTRERARELAARTRRPRARSSPRWRSGMALVFAGEGERGARAIRRGVAELEASDELREDPQLARRGRRSGRSGCARREAGRSLTTRALELVAQPDGARRAA